MVSVPAGQRISRYLVERKLGEGQMGDVYAATSPDGELVAVKVLRFGGGSTTELERRFRREATLCARLDHPNIVAVRDHGIHEGVPFLTMPLLSGADLEVWSERSGAFAPEVAVAIVLAACDGLSFAHARGVVHRDLKPANLFLHEEADGGVRVIVCDFGVAKVYDEDGSLTASGSVMGTPLFMAPEQLVDAKRVDARCDVWAVGMVLYQLLCGRAAFADATGLADLIVKLERGEVPSIQTFAPWVQTGLARVVHAALLPLADRFSTIEELARALRAWGPSPAALTKASLAPIAAERRRHDATRAILPRRAAELGTPDEETYSAARSPRAMSAPPSDPALGVIVDGRYEVLEKLGGGGMGAVYAARDLAAPPGAPEEVAVKLMVASRDGTEGTRRLLREAKAASRIESPHVTKVLGWGTDASGSPYLVMERLRGMDLAALLAKSGAIEPEIAVALLAQAASGIAAAHGLGIVHRDIKPSNLFLHEGEGGEVTVKVCDFGIAKQLLRDDVSATSTEITRTGGLLGSPLYMSPEQARSAKSVDERTDVFSLALTLHETLSGARPWQGRTSMGEIILAVCTEDVPALSVCAPWVPADLSTTVARALVRDADARTRTVDAFASALRPFAARAPLRMSELRAVSAEKRATVAPVGALSAGGNTASALSLTTPPSRSRSWVLSVAVVTLAALVLGAGTLLLRASSSGRPTLGSTEASASASSEAPSADALPVSAVVSSPSGAPSPSAAEASAPELASAPSTTASTASAPVNVGKPSRPSPNKPGAVGERPALSGPPPAPPLSPPAVSSSPGSPAKPASSLGRGNIGADVPF